MPRRAVPSVLVLAVVCAAAASAAGLQGIRGDTPDQLVERYFRAIADGRFDEAALLMEPAALDRLRDTLLPVLLAAPASPGKPGALTLLDGVESAEAARALSGAGFFSAFLRGVAKVNPAFAEAFGSISGEVVGSVPEGPDTLHFVCRSKARVANVALTKMIVVTLHRAAGEWRVALSSEIEGMVEAIRKGLAGRQAPR
jgi:hypothetical protein